MKFTKKYLPAIVVVFIFFFISHRTYARVATQTFTYTTQTDFDGSNLSTNIEIDESPGDIKIQEDSHKVVHSTISDFDLGTYTSTSNTEDDGGKINLLSGFYTYGQNSAPSFSTYLNSDLRERQAINYNSKNKLLYLSTVLDGLYVLDTKGTNIQSDDVIVAHYTTTSTPAINMMEVTGVFFDNINDLIYIITNKKTSPFMAYVTAIDTKGTATQTDDEILKVYTYGDTRIWMGYYSPSLDLIFISTYWSGIPVIDRNNTLDTSDDTYFSYSTGAAPQIPHQFNCSLYFDETTKYLYASTMGGLAIINTNNTKTKADDTLISTTNHATLPALPYTEIKKSFFDSRTNLLYYSASWRNETGFAIIDTKGTPSVADDEVVKILNTASTPAINANWIYDFYFDTTTNYLHITTGTGYDVIDTKGNSTVSDDVVIKSMKTGVNGLEMFANFVRADDLGGIFVTTSGANYFAFLQDQIKYVDYGSYYRTKFAWQTKTDLPQAIVGAMSGVIDGKIYVVGAMTSEWDPSSVLYAYNPSSDVWETKASMSTEHGTPLAGVIDGKLYVVGGRDYANWNGLKTLEVYDPSTNTWETKASMSVARVGPAGDAYDGKLYVVGGSSKSCGTVQPSLEVYTPSSNSWETKTPIPITKAMGASAKFINGKLYVVGGQVGCNDPFSNLLTVYDPNTDTWDTTKANLPQNRAGGVTVVHDGKLLYIGGTDDNYDSVSDIFRYDPNTDTWETISSLPTRIHRAVAQIINGNLYVIGGKNNYWDAMDTTLSFSLNLPDTLKITSMSLLATIPTNTSLDILYSLDGGSTFTSLGNNSGEYSIFSGLTDNFVYKFVMESDADNQTPTVGNIEIGYQVPGVPFYKSSGSYISPVLDSSLTANWSTLTSSVDTPVGTSVTFYTRSGHLSTVDSSWSDWEEIKESGEIVSRDNRYIQYKAVLETTDTNETPVIHDITLTYEEATPATNTPNQGEKKAEIEKVKGNTVKKNEDKAVVIVESDTVPYDVYSETNVIKKYTPMYLDNHSSWQISDIVSIYLRSFFNDALIIETDKPYIVSLTYSNDDLMFADSNGSFSPYSLYLVYKEDDKQTTWNRLYTSVVDTVNHTVSATTKKGGLFMIVASDRYTYTPSSLTTNTIDSLTTKEETNNTNKTKTSEKKVSAETQKDIQTNSNTPQIKEDENIFQMIIEWVQEIFK